MRSPKQTAFVTLNREAGDLQGQLYHEIRGRILNGGLSAGVRLPSTRHLAASLGIARATVVAAYERLQAEGYVLNEAGKASRVANIAPPLAAQKHPKPPTAPPLSTPPTQLPRHLEPGVPDLTSFPSALWGRLLASGARHMPPALLGYASPSDFPALKEAILAHIALRRGVVALPEQVVLFPSTRTAIALIARVAMRRPSPNPACVWVEDPAYPSAKRILQAEGGHLVPIAVDDSGLDIEQTSTLPAPRLIYVTPSHQYPTGATMSLPRRLQLLERAQQNRALILEDDYDSEFQFNGRPIAALQGIDHAGCVAYLGTLSKVLAPGVRLAYAVVPQSLLAEVQNEAALTGIAVSTHIQAAFLTFLREGHFGAHIKRMTTHYAARMAAFRSAIVQLCPQSLTPGPGTGGLQLALWFNNPSFNDQAIAAALRRHLYAPAPLSSMYGDAALAKPGLLCGIANLPVEQATLAASTIARLIKLQ